MGLDRVLLAMEAEGVPLPPPRGPHCFVVAMGDDARRAGRSLIADLRDAGISATGSDEERPLKAQLKMADRAGAAFVALLGDRELSDGTVTLRRLVDGVQKSVARVEVAGWLGRLDGWVASDE
jgi:histidyl-tRNA synthetase